jgi:Uma2 family endonuclease
MIKMERVEVRYTYEDYLRLPDDGKIYQIIRGKLFRMPAPVPYHQIVSGNLYSIIRSYVRAENLGEVFYAPCDVVLSDVDIVQPDIIFISKERDYLIGDKNIRGAPDLVIEIISQRSEYLDRKVKVELYEEYGVKEYWLVDPDRKEVEVLTLTREGYKSMGVFNKSFSSPLLKLEVKLSEIF